MVNRPHVLQMGHTKEQLEARDIMQAFAADTGLLFDVSPRRYLWTDAYAVGNFIVLHNLFPNEGYLQMAEVLADQVHHVLGAHRGDDARTGWLSGFENSEAEHHPTAGGLRIGKPVPERCPDEPYDPDKEWDRDGQYYHYLTKWMSALAQLYRATDRADYHRWACELADVAFQRFSSPADPGLLRWKMSIDLTRALVSHTGQHDALDGLITALVLAADAPDARLSPIITTLQPICMHQNWTTNDALGIGGLLADAVRLAHLPTTAYNRALLNTVLSQALLGLRHFLAQPHLELPANQRLAFRELGLAIGLRGIRPHQRGSLTRRVQYRRYA